MKYRATVGDGVFGAYQWKGHGADAMGSDPIRPYSLAYVDGDVRCQYCEQRKNDHGMIEEELGDYLVCPGDFIVTSQVGESFPVHADIFPTLFVPLESSYEAIDELSRPDGG